MLYTLNIKGSMFCSASTVHLMYTLTFHNGKGNKNGQLLEGPMQQKMFIITTSN
jgi:hypothetical protein